MTHSRWTVDVTPAATAVILRELQLGGRTVETGGILLGHDDEVARTTTVTAAGGPGGDAVRRPRFFSRDLAYASELADLAWSADQSVWVGEWHTHTSGPPVPSELDLGSYVRHLRDPELAFDRFVSVIVAVGPQVVPEIAGWVVTREVCERARLTLADVE